MGLEPLGVGPGERSELLEELGWLPLGEMAGLELLRPKRRMVAATGECRRKVWCRALAAGKFDWEGQAIHMERSANARVAE